MNRDQLIASGQALLDLDARGALVPHGIGGHAREIIEGFIALSSLPAHAVGDEPLDANGYPTGSMASAADDDQFAARLADGSASLAPSQPAAVGEWKPITDHTPPDDQYWQMAVDVIERAGKGFHHAVLTNHHAATLLYWANLARNAALRSTP